MPDISKPSAASRVFRADEVRPGQSVAYTGGKTPVPVERDWLAVTRVDEHGIHGVRVHPEAWERDYEYVIVPKQIEANGVIVRV